MSSNSLTAIIEYRSEKILSGIINSSPAKPQILLVLELK
jgi:hypothetical protein